MSKEYIPLEDLEVYKLAMKMSDISWEVFTKLPKHLQYSIGDQFVRSTDSIGANIAEGYGRFSFQDRIRILYIARGSYFESKKHWLSLLKRRELISDLSFEAYTSLGNQFELKLNLWIKSLRALKPQS